MILSAMYCWDTCTLTRTTYLGIVADQVYPFMGKVFPDDYGFFRRNNWSWHKGKMIQELFEMHNKFDMMKWAPDSSDLWDVLDKQVTNRFRFFEQ